MMHNLQLMLINVLIRSLKFHKVV